MGIMTQATDKQLGYLRALIGKLGLLADDPIHERIDAADLSVGEASALITRIRAMVDALPPKPKHGGTLTLVKPKRLTDDDIELGLYTEPSGTFIRVYNGRSGIKLCQEYNPDATDGIRPWDYIGSAVRMFNGNVEYVKLPAEEVARFGQITGQCGFCATTLDDGNSIALGYGPTCAQKHGLPHPGYSGKSASRRK